MDCFYDVERILKFSLPPYNCESLQTISARSIVSDPKCVELLTGHIKDRAVPLFACKGLLLATLSAPTNENLTYLLRALIEFWPSAGLLVDFNEIPAKYLKNDSYSKFAKDYFAANELKADLVIRIFLELFGSNALVIGDINNLHLRNATLSQSMLHRLCQHINLALCEVQKRSILDCVKLAAERGKIDQQQAKSFGDLEESNVLKESKFKLIIDCRIEGVEMKLFQDLARAFQAAHFENSPLKINICTLLAPQCDMQFLGEWLTMCKPRNIRGLAVASKFPLPQQMLNDLYLLSALTSLHLSVMSTSVQNTFWGDVLLKCISLRRLTIESHDAPATRNRLNSNLSQLPKQDGLFTLTYLNLDGYHLSPIDLIFLSAQFKCPSMEQLILNNNDLSEGSALSSLCILLKHNMPNLRLIALSFCKINNQLIGRLFDTFSRCKLLRWIDLSYNDFTESVLVVNLTRLIQNDLNNLTFRSATDSPVFPSVRHFWIKSNLFDNFNVVKSIEGRLGSSLAGKISLN